MHETKRVVVIGAGFTGLTAAWRLAESKFSVTLLERDEAPGGMAGTFEFSDGTRIEKFYHHWFINDYWIPRIATELGIGDLLKVLPSKTGVYYQKHFWNMTTPLDLLHFKPLPFFSRLRLGFVVLAVRFITDWKKIEHLSVREWLEPLVGKEAYRIVWEPLIAAKFSIYADDVNAVWFWKKLVLRGSTRGKQGKEELMYVKGGFGLLAERMCERIRELGGKVLFSQKVVDAEYSGNHMVAVKTLEGRYDADEFIFTPSFSIIAEILSGCGDSEWLNKLRRVKYLGNICLVLELRKSLSELYWINVNDPGFPFVGVIEHTNLDVDGEYNGKKLVFLSSYIATNTKEWNYSDAEYFQYAITHVKTMFPDFSSDSIVSYKIWREPYAQPVTERGYSSYVPGHTTPYLNLHISTMAQVYPEDRGTNYAIRNGNEIAGKIAKQYI